MANPTITNKTVREVDAGNNFYRQVTLAASQTVKAGDVLGRITASGQYKKAAITAADGTEDAVCVVAAGQPDVTTGAGATASITVIVTGEVNGAALGFTLAETVDSKKANKKSHRENLQDNAITVLDIADSVASRDNQ